MASTGPNNGPKNILNPTTTNNVVTEFQIPIMQQVTRLSSIFSTTYSTTSSNISAIITSSSSSTSSTTTTTLTPSASTVVGPAVGVVGGGTINTNSGQISGFASIAPVPANNIRILPSSSQQPTTMTNIHYTPQNLTSSASVVASQHGQQQQPPPPIIKSAFIPSSNVNVTLSPITLNQNYVLSSSGTTAQVYIQQQPIRPAGQQQQQHLIDDKNSITIHHHQHRHNKPVLSEPPAIIGLGNSSSSSSSTNPNLNHPPNNNSNNNNNPINIHQSSSTTTDSSLPENRLKVEDALNYLDQVKYKFSTQPQVYNDFLDIMKEFKSQTIDTPGVISRVSNLFYGHPELIVGFNTFLPPGYKVEISFSMGSHGQSSGYTVTTVQTDPNNGNGIENHHHQHHHGGETSILQQQMSGQQQQRHILVRPSIGIGSGATAETRTYNFGRGGNSSPPPSGSALSMAAASMNNFDCINLQSQPPEFNHAVNYVNKIKQRFNGQPEKYKQFLDILQIYQKEKRSSTKHFTEHEVYSQMSKLFENQDDLLQEFGQFLHPESANNQNMTIKNVIDQAKESAAKVNGEVTSTSKKTKVSATKKHPVRSQAPPSAAATKKRKRVTSTESTSGLPPAPPLPPPPLALTTPLPPPPIIRLAEVQDYGTSTDFAMFDKIRETIKNEEWYSGFLRCLKLYNDEVINRGELLTMIQPTLGKHARLLNTFKEFLNGTPLHEIEPPAPPPVPVIPMKLLEREEIKVEDIDIDISTLDRVGTSYYTLPSNHFPPKCSGRTEADKLVLNDKYVSSPSLNPSTTSTSSSTKPNSRKIDYDEYDYQCEDQRFELDMILESNASAIRYLEIISKKLSRMTPEEIKTYKLEDNMLGSAEPICTRAIRRLYGDMSNKIIDGMKNVPSLAIPILLKRLKDKEFEWRDAQKLFNKYWREQMEKFYPQLPTSLTAAITSMTDSSKSGKQNGITKERKQSKGIAKADEISGSGGGGGTVDEDRDSLSSHSSGQLQAPPIIPLLESTTKQDPTVTNNIDDGNRNEDGNILTQPCPF